MQTIGAVAQHTRHMPDAASGQLALFDPSLTLGRSEPDTYFFLMTPHHTAISSVPAHRQQKLGGQFFGRGVNELGTLFGNVLHDALAQWRASARKQERR
jgi:hypothetical protein